MGFIVRLAFIPLAIFYLLLTALLLIFFSSPASAHGVKITAKPLQQVEIQANFDTGDPMAGGQVNIYAPGEPGVPWQKGICDEQGKYVFSPDPNLKGRWEIQVRHSGHGDIVYFNFGEDNQTAAASSNSLTTTQKALMTISVLWGFIGTGLYFARRNT